MPSLGPHFDGTTVFLKDTVGMGYIARLLAEPDREIPAVTQLAACAGIGAGNPDDVFGLKFEVKPKSSPLLADKPAGRKLSAPSGLRSECRPVAPR